MAIIKKSEFKQMSKVQLNEKLNELKKELMKYNAQVSTGTVPENPGKIKSIKKTIARINTRINIIQTNKIQQGGKEKTT